MYPYEVNFNGRTSHMSNYFYCHIQPKGLLYDAERHVLPMQWLSFHVLCTNEF